MSPWQNVSLDQNPTINALGRTKALRKYSDMVPSLSFCGLSGKTKILNVETFYEPNAKDQRLQGTVHEAYGFIAIL